MLGTKLQAMILAAGRSSRFRTGSSKLSFPLCGQEMIVYAGKLFEELAIPMTFIVGYQKETITSIITRHEIANTSFIEQEKQQGTGHAIACTKSAWFADHIIITNGDAPLITQDIIEELVDTHVRTDSAVSFVTAYNYDPSISGYGRVLEKDGVVTIIEEHNIQDESYVRYPVNAGIYIVKRSFLEQAITKLTPDKESGEYYFPQIVDIATQENKTVSTTVAPFDSIRGVNTLRELWAAEHIKRSELIAYWMNRGVRFSAAQNVYLDLNVKIGRGTFIGNGASIVKGSMIGENCHIDASCHISNSIIHDNVVMHPLCVVHDSEIKQSAQVGPFASVRNNSLVGERSCIGNFVEVKKSTIGTDTKAKHLAYIGNTIMGSNVTFGAGSVTCNYNGFTKNTTTIESNVMVGSNNSLVAPITLKDGCMTAAGSALTQDVPAGALAFGRARQTNKENYVEKLQERYETKKKNPGFLGAKKLSQSEYSQ